MPLTDETRVAAREIMARYPRPRSALLPMLHLVQSEEGYVTPEGVRFCAEELGLTKAEVGAVATFYTMYKRRPTGEYLVSVCTNTLCDVLGGQEIYETLSEQLGVGHDQTTADGRITLEHAECLAACDYAPVVTVNYEFFDQQTPESAIELVERAAGGPAAAADPGRAAVHVQGDQPAAGRVHRRAAGRGRRRVGRRADAGRHPAGGAAGRDGARRTTRRPRSTSRPSPRPGRRAGRRDCAARRAADGRPASRPARRPRPRPSSPPPPAPPRLRRRRPDAAVERRRRGWPRPDAARVRPGRPTSGADEGPDGRQPRDRRRPDGPAVGAGPGDRPLPDRRPQTGRSRRGPADAHQPRAQDPAQGELSRAADPGADQAVAVAPLLDAGDVRAARGLPGAAQGADRR